MSRALIHLSTWILLGLAASGSLVRAGDTFRKQVVVSQQADASAIGRDVLRKGGNAVDAAVATAFALAVTHPAAGNLGGGGFLVAYLPDKKQVVTIDFRETAPKASTADMYLGPDGKPLANHRAGARAAGVPGTVQGLGLARERFGRLAWSELVRPSAKLARDGFALSETLARSLNAQIFPKGKVDLAGVPEDLDSDTDRLAHFPSSVAAYRRPDGKPWQAGDRLTQPDLADTLDRIASGGPDEFYRGKTAELIADYCRANGGLITRQDLADYQAKQREPVKGTFRGFEVYGMGPPASGGILVVQMLNVLENFDLKKDGPRSPETLHRVTEAMRRGFYSRAAFIADPDVVEVPVDRLISKTFAQTLARSIGPKATASASLAPYPIEIAEGNHTTHLSTIDGEGGAAALTYTLEEGYGSKAVVAGAGFLLNNEMGDFNLIPGRTDDRGRIGTAPNLIAPGKRMLSSQSPTIVLKDGKVRVVTGSPGGRTIPNTTLWVLLNLLEFRLSPREAVDAARTHHAWFPDVLAMEGTRWEPVTLAELRAKGHKVRVGGIQGDAHTIVVDEQGTIHGLADPRRKTSTASGD